MVGNIIYRVNYSLAKPSEHNSPDFLCLNFFTKFPPRNYFKKNLKTLNYASTLVQPESRIGFFVQPT